MTYTKIKHVVTAYITISLTFLFSLISYAQEQNLEDLNLNGSVKSYEAKVYSAINNGDSIVKGNPFIA